MVSQFETETHLALLVGQCAEALMLAQSNYAYAMLGTQRPMLLLRSFCARCSTHVLLL